ncbi:unnamed protein product [Clonostachys rhizophaga]|uniref:Uncharacterized protein n=1 Tax=Clonostachys rhizophaga TaxID=160324 RepID=A0A9N9VYR0_9HYPO|nr:unnamed protein product [Clonostachys rhizophaga]
MTSLAHVLTHPLRRLTIAAFFPALILSTVDASLSGPVRIAGFSAIFISAIVSTFLLCFKRRNPTKGHGGLKISILIFVYDTLSAAGLLTFLIFTWIYLGSWWRDAGLAVLTAYASVPYILVFCIHAYLALLTLIDFIDRPRHCPHCECDLYSRTPDAAPGFSHAQVSRGVYSSLHGVDHQAVERPSVDSDADEDARLLGDEESRVGLVHNIVPVPIGGSRKDEIKVEVV